MVELKIIRVSEEEVNEICAQLGLGNWYLSPDVTPDSVTKIMAYIGITEEEVPLEVFMMGLDTELEHGTANPEFNITNNHPILTALIAMAHINESVDYYYKLAEMEKGLELSNAMIELGEAAATGSFEMVREAIEEFERVDQGREE